MNGIDDEKFQKLRQQAEEDYKKIVKVRCPYLQDDVHFSTEGFQHLLFKEWNKTRSRLDQYTRLRLLPLAVKIISKSHTLQEYEERGMFVRQKISSRWEKHLKTVKYYVFIALVKEVRVKVIVKEVEGGTKQFHSLYPSWKVDKSSGRKVFYSGNLEVD